MLHLASRGPGRRTARIVQARMSADMTCRERLLLTGVGLMCCDIADVQCTLHKHFAVIIGRSLQLNQLTACQVLDLFTLLFEVLHRGSVACKQTSWT